nr:MULTISPECIES: hypothetical protein [unclassified Paraburkholderia]
MIVQPQLRIGRVDAPVARNRIVNGYDGLGLLLIEPPAVDAVVPVVFGPFASSASSSFQFG